MKYVSMWIFPLLLRSSWLWHLCWTWVYFWKCLRSLWLMYG